MNCSRAVNRRSKRIYYGALYPELGPDAQKEIQAQYIIDYYDMPVTLPDFAFPECEDSDLLRRV